MRRTIPLLVVGVALAGALPAGAALAPIQRPSGTRTVPRVRAGIIALQPAGSAGTVRVIADLRLPPLAAAQGRGLAAAGARRRLDVRGVGARAYLARLAAAQTRAVAALRRAIPEVRVGRRFRILLDGLTLELPARRLPTLLSQHEVARVYPSLRYTLALDRSPSLIGADVVRAERGADGTGMKIAVVDDGIDQTNPFFSPAGFSYPTGFPRGGRRWTTPKVIVARAFPGPGSGRAGRLALDPKESFHGTHVAGIAAGDAGTTAPAGRDHPRVAGLSGVAPRAWLGNYRVFTVPTPVGNVANTPEIVAAFEAAVADGMDVINFSGGGPEVEPANDALVEAVHNVAAAGVVPVISAGNDRDDYGTGSVGSPGTAPDAISVAAVSNSHVFAPALDVTAPDAPASVQGIPFVGAGGSTAPPAWGTADQTLVDVGSILGTDGTPVDRLLCGPRGDLASVRGTLPARSLAGAIALVDRGTCPLQTKARQARAAGATGIVVVDNRQGEANQLPSRLALPGGTIANVDGQRLRALLAESDGRTTIRIGSRPLELDTGRGGVVTSFSSGGPTAFGHALKPDVSAPGGQILSATLPHTDPSRFAVFDGTSMAAPHVSGAAALLLQLHPTWTPAQVKSALVSTAAPAWEDTARTQEAPVTLEGGGLVSLPAAADPRLFTDPSSLSFADLDVSRGGASRALLIRLADAGGGAGAWQVTVDAQEATAGASVSAAGPVLVPPGGEADLAVTVGAPAGATQGENAGFVVLRQGDVTRRVPYLFVVDRPALAAAPVLELKRRQSGDTRVGPDRVDEYRYPSAPFGNAPGEPPMREDGAERVYRMDLNAPAANVGVSLVSATPGAQIDPFFLGALDESAVQGYAGTPIDVNPLTYEYLNRIGAAGSSFPRQQTFYVAVDSGRDELTGRRLGGRYVLRSWVNDVTPPKLRLLTTTVAAGRPALVVRALDGQSGVDPLSLTLGFEGIVLGASSYDPDTGIAVFPLPPRDVAPLAPGRLTLRVMASDFQEAKNVDTTGTSIMPNTRVISAALRIVRRPVAQWLAPAARSCVARTQELLVAASAPGGVRLVRFEADGRLVAVARAETEGLWRGSWRTAGLARGRHVLTAVAVDHGRRTAVAQRMVTVCR